MTAYFSLPICVASSKLTSINAARLAIEDFSVLPATMNTIYIYSSRVAYNASSGFGINPDSSIYWKELWGRFPSLRTLSIYFSGLTGSLPDALPSTIASFAVPDNYLSGTIPPTILSNVINTTADVSAYTLQIGLSNNRLSGTIPESLFSGYRTTQAMFNGLAIDFQANTALSGTISPSLLYPLQSASFSVFSFSFGSTSLNGSLPDNFIPSGLLRPQGIFSLSLVRAKLSGSIPSAMLGNLTSFSQFFLSLSGNTALTGSLPQSLLPGTWRSGNAVGTISSFSLDFSRCGLTGTIPPTFFAGTLVQNVSIASLSLDLSYNQLTGAIPETLLYNSLASIPYSAQATIATITLTNNSLTGSLPSTPFQYLNPPAAYSFSLYLGNNPSLNGVIPSSLLAPFAGGSQVSNLYFDATNTAISGSPPSACTIGSTTFILASSQLDGTIPTTWASCGMKSIDLSNNPKFEASIPDALLNLSSLTKFLAENTPLSGNLGPVSSTVTALNLKRTKIEFCSALTSAYSPALSTVCNLLETSACNCQARFGQCLVSCLTPISAPIMPVPTGCSQNTRPTGDFACVNGVWTATSTVSTPTLTIPSGAGTVVVAGNLTSSTLVFHGVGSTININGSVGGLTTITLEFDSNQASNLGGQKVLQILVNTSGSNSSTDLSLVNVNTKVTSGCRKVKSEKATFDGGKTLGVYLSVDSSGCNTWWIILVSVVVAVIVIAAVVLVLLAVFYEPFRLKIRPYSGGRKVGQPSAELN